MSGYVELAGGNDIKQRRGRAVKTAWLLAAIALAIFIAFILSGVLGS